MVRVRAAPSSARQSSTTTSIPSGNREALKEKTNIARSKRTLAREDSSDGLVKTAKPQRKATRLASRDVDDEAELMMTGGLGSADEDISSVVGPRDLEEVAMNRRAPRTKSRVPPTSTRSTTSSTQHGKPYNPAEQSDSRTLRGKKPANALDTGSKRTAPSSVSALTSQPSQDALELSISKLEGQRSEFSLSPSPPRSTTKSMRQSFAQPGSALRVHGTPSMGDSILALRKFKRRPRQPSMLQMVQQRRASMQTSAVGDSLLGVQLAELDMGNDEDEDEDDFTPEAESTPLQIGKISTVPIAASSNRSGPTTSLPRSHKRKSDEADLSFSRLDSSGKRPRNTAAQNPRRDIVPSPHRSASRTEFDARDTEPSVTTASEQVIISSSLEIMPLNPSSTIEHNIDEPEILVPSTDRQHSGNGEEHSEQDLPVDIVHDGGDDVMAEPASSSPIPSRPSASQSTDIMAEPLTQISPPRQHQRRKAKPKPMLTSTLQALLPQRRQPRRPRQRKTEFDMQSSEDELTTTLPNENDDEDDDEIDEGEAEWTQIPRRQNKASRLKGKNAKPTRATFRKSKSVSASTKRAGRKLSTVVANNPQRRYVGRPTSDKENEAQAPTGVVDGDNDEDEDFPPPPDEDSLLPDTSITMDEAAQSTELAAAKRKFADVDEWEMEFESMSQDEHRSSSQLWR